MGLHAIGSCSRGGSRAQAELSHMRLLLLLVQPHVLVWSSMYSPQSPAGPLPLPVHLVVLSRCTLTRNPTNSAYTVRQVDWWHQHV